MIENTLQTTCINCRHGGFVDGDVYCGIESVEMDPNDSCNCFERGVTRAMIEEYSRKNQVPLIIANLYLNEYGVV